VRIYVFSECYFKFWPLIFKHNKTLLQTAENSDASVTAFLNKREVDTWSMRMVLIHCIDIVYRLIILKIFLITESEIH
jgi:hypothetical protein